MADITASMVKELRERTGAGMMDCKNALVEAAGDMAKAAEIIQKKGLAKAVKAAGRIAADGMVIAEVSSSGNEGVLVEVNCQTDFVARGDDFKAFAALVAKQALASGAGDVAALEAAVVDGKSLREHAEVLTARSGEKHAIRRVQKFSGDVVVSYIHHGSRLGVLVQLSHDKGNTPAATEFANDVALQVASMNPKYIRREEATADTLAKQAEIFAGQLKTEEEEAVKELEEWKARMAEEAGEHSDAVKDKLTALEKKAKSLTSRPQQAKDKIVEGKRNKWLSEMTLLEQSSVKDSNSTIQQLLQAFTKENGRTEIVRFARFELGEGIDKGETKDFASEVAAMTAAAQKS